MIIKETTIPSTSLIYRFLPGDYLDAFKATFIPRKSSTPDDLQVEFWTKAPKWVDFLFKVRNNLVKIVGLKTDKLDQKELETCIRENKEFKIFSVVAKSENETILKLSDKHLDAFMSIYLVSNQDTSLTVYSITVVHYHNKLGQIYFNVIRPLHAIVVKAMLKSILMNM